MGAPGRFAPGVALALVLAGCGAATAQEHPRRNDDAVERLRSTWTAAPGSAARTRAGRVEADDAPTGPNGSDALSGAAGQPDGSGEEAPGGFLSREQIERVVKRHQRGIQLCYEKELQSEPSLAGRIRVSWTIGLDGRVTQAWVTENTMGNRKVEACILREVQGMRFDQPRGGMVAVHYPFTFRSIE